MKALVLGGPCKAGMAAHCEAIAGAARIIAVDTAESRLRHAERCGATHTVLGGEDAEAQILELAYDVFAAAGEHDALKVVLTA